MLRGEFLAKVRRNLGHKRLNEISLERENYKNMELHKDRKFALFSPMYPMPKYCVKHIINAGP